MARRKTCLLLCLFSIIINVWTYGTEAAKPGRQRVTVTIVNRRLVTAEKTLIAVKQELNDTITQLHQLQAKVQALEAQGGSNDGAAGVIPQRQKFSDLPPCPDVDGFYYSATMSSCYHLEPASVMSNFSEATSTCEELHPKAHIVTVENRAEQNFLRDKWFNERGIASISRFWINLKKVDNRNQWKWEHNKRRLLFSHWIPTTSHDDDRFQCAAVYSNEAYFWGDVACWGPHMVTCEVDM